MFKHIWLVLKVEERGWLALLVIAAVILSSCEMPQQLRAKYSDPNDGCQVIRDELINSQDYFAGNIAAGVAIGALLGGLLGALAGGDIEGAAIGALAGGLTGAAGGYLRAKSQQAQSQAELRQAIYADVRQDNGRVSQMGSVIRRLNECRQGQIVKIEQEFKTGVLSKDKARSRLEAVRSSVDKDNALVKEILQDVDERNAVYVESIAEVEQTDKSVVLGDAATPVRTEEGKSERFFAKTGSNVRKEPRKSAARVGTLSKNTPIDVLGTVENGQWYQVRYQGKTAYVFAELLGRETVSDRLPVVEASNQPQPTNDVQKLLMSTREIDEEYNEQVAVLERDLDRLEALTL